MTLPTSTMTLLPIYYDLLYYDVTNLYYDVTTLSTMTLLPTLL